MSVRSNTASTPSWSTHVETIRAQRDQARRELAAVRAELEDLKAEHLHTEIELRGLQTVHRHRAETLAGPHGDPDEDEWASLRGGEDLDDRIEKLPVSHEILPPAA